MFLREHFKILKSNPLPPDEFLDSLEKRLDIIKNTAVEAQPRKHENSRILV
jgi:hypothetical protein